MGLGTDNQTLGAERDLGQDQSYRDRNDNPLLKQPQNQSDFVADTATTGTYATDDDAIVANINAIRDCLVEQGLMKAS